ncbi:MAG TPA: homoserine dehydrogenase [Chthonomonadaceae bacterium]|nr:homoserine dehydrogenase [Chthonomonadaceae bacterium]
MSHPPVRQWNKDRIEIGILGLGVVGSGTVALLERNKAEIERKVGLPLHIKRIAVRDLHKPRAVTVNPALLTTDPSDILDDPDIDIVCELIGGVEPARTFVLRALQSGKQVVTANKEMIAKEGHELMEEAAKRWLDFQFEGSVAGGIPIIQPMKNALAGNQIQEVMGIINGTTNYILTKMTREHADFGEALKEAQAHGYAEADPTSDIEGYDAQYKIAILASIAFTSRVHVSDVAVEGITKIAKPDIEYADELGYVIKLLGVAKRVGADRMQVRVHPTLLPKSHPLAATNDVYNAVLVKGDSVGDVMFYGRGAGSGPTGSAVVGDILDVCRNLRFGSTGRVACTCFESKAMQPIEEVETRHYIRMVVKDQPKVLAAISTVFGDYHINIEAMIQKATSGAQTDIIWLMHETPGKSIADALKVIAKLPVVLEVSNWLRVEE